MVKDLGVRFKVRVWGLGIWGSGFRVSSLGFMIMVWGLRFMVGLRF